jgi:SRSO17 transposase
VAVSLSVATAEASLPVSYRLYLPREWSDAPERRQKAGVPEQIEFATKPEIAAGQLREARQSGAPDGVVLTDAGYGDDTSFREASASSDCSMQWAFARTHAYGRRVRLLCRPSPPRGSRAGRAAYYDARRGMSRSASKIWP